MKLSYQLIGRLNFEIEVFESCFGVQVKIIFKFEIKVNYYYNCYFSFRMQVLISTINGNYTIIYFLYNGHILK